MQHVVTAANEEARVDLGGRPSGYKPAFCAQVILLGRKGKSKAQIAAALDVSRQTVDNWCAAFPEFLDAITRARDLSMAWWEDKGQASVLNPKFQAAFWSRSMAARFPDDYRETNRQEHTGAKGGPILTAREMTDEQLAFIAASRGE